MTEIQKKFKPKVNKKHFLDYKPKDYKIPKDMVVLIDTQEKQPFFTDIKKLNKIDQTLKTGDYSIKGFEDRFCIERKMTSDFYGFIGDERNVKKYGRDKTLEKIKRMAQMEWSALVIEADIHELLKPQMFTKVSPEVARQFLVSCEVRYGIHVFVHKDKEMCERWCLDRCIKWYNIQREI